MGTFERNLAKKLLKMLKGRGTEGRILRKIDESKVNNLENEISNLQFNSILNKNTKQTVDNVLSLYCNEKFETQFFNKILNSKDNEASYLIRCLLRILVDKYSKDFLNEFPEYLQKKYLLINLQKVFNNTISGDFKNASDDFIHLLSYMKQKYNMDVNSVNDDGINELIIKCHGNLKYRICTIIDFTRYHFNYNSFDFFEKKEIEFEKRFDSFAMRVERYYLYLCLDFLIRLFDIDGIKIQRQIKYLKDNPSSFLENFCIEYEKKTGIKFNAFEGCVFSSSLVTNIFFDMMTALISSLYRIRVSNFSFNLKTIFTKFILSGEVGFLCHNSFIN